MFDRIKYQQERYQRLKVERIKLALDRLGSKCVRCGAIDNLEFDHIDSRTRRFRVPTGIQASLVVFLREVDKCQLLCVPCHEQKTREENGWFKVGDLTGRPHGHVTTYDAGCKCQECREAVAIDKAARYGRRTKYLP